MLMPDYWYKHFMKKHIHGLPSSDYWCNDSQMQNYYQGVEFSIFLSRVGFTRSGEREANASRHGEKTTRYDYQTSRSL